MGRVESGERSPPVVISRRNPSAVQEEINIVGQYEVLKVRG
jgi:hypothetical protein